MGSDKIVEKTYEFYKSNKRREEIELRDFESIIKNQVYNDESSMKYSSLITSHLINHFIPFLPLERAHIDQCIDASLDDLAEQGKTNGYRYRVSQSDRTKIKENIFRSLEWWPADLKLYSNSGCKQVANKVDISIGLST